MNILMINLVHPRTPHISAVRAWKFSQQLASLGHRIVLLTGPEPEGSVDSPTNFDLHDWAKPYVIPVHTVLNSPEIAPYGSQFFRKLQTAWSLLSRGGTQGDWTIRAARLMSNIQDSYTPQLIWSTFGKMEAVLAAKRIATHARCPWVLDIKDNWELYVPSGLRRVMAWRTRGWSAVTANAQFTADKARNWQHAQAEVVYSGVDDAFYERSHGSDGNDSDFQINLIGSLYFREHLLSFLSGLQDWVATLSAAQARNVKLCYIGSDTAKFDDAMRSCKRGFAVINMGYVETKRMAVICQNGALNAYIGHPGTFHHKLLELIVCGRPVFVVPRCGGEEKALTHKANGTLLEAADDSEVAYTLARLYAHWQNQPQGDGVDGSLREYTWQMQSLKLNELFKKVAKTGQITA